VNRAHFCREGVTSNFAWCRILSAENWRHAACAKISDMAKSSSAKQWINLRLTHDGVQPGTPLDEPLRFGLQDSKNEVHPGITRPGGLRNFELTLEVSGGREGQPVFRSAFAHGPPAARFVYLSWKREGAHQHPWGWRIKIPLSGIGWAEIRAAEEPDKCLAADVTGRRPHASEAINWQVEPFPNSRPFQNS
jgi:hypothetical protein